MGLVRVLINDAVKSHLLNAAESERRQIRKSFEYLESGLWEGGLKIKRLKGVSRTVLEARISRSDRLLFTLARETEEPRALLVHIWAIVPHDDVDRRARAIDSDAAPFLSFDAREILDASDVDMEALGNSIITTDRSGERQWTDSAPQRWFLLDDTEWQRLLIYSKDDFEIFLYLTPEQRGLLEKDPPLLVSGTAGSGKTTLSVYYLLRHQLQDRSCLFLTYNRHLRNFCQRLYAGLINQRSMRALHDVQFRTFKELCLQIVGREAVRFAPEREVDAFSFYGLYRRHRLSDRFDSAVVWEEIRSIIKGAKPQITANVLRGILKEWSVPAQDSERVRVLR
ncbi:MAG TPA: UvrD-helicase domain-containing protein, partial [Acidobacteriota bacterium]|nr:UvrD-helicase domain-containing protein [Acidobacteriota bacterium]